jgi:acyl-CoA synthetase (AMP-forming)/AMP-acid ligase II/thioesterase domain-containing protein/acyl carrier protein
VSQATGSTRPTSKSTATYRSRDTIPGAFRAVVAQHPDRVAYREPTRSVTYGQLDALSNRVARHLIRRDRDQPMVFVAPLRVESFALVLGALKAAVLVTPLDPRWPKEQWVEVAHKVDGVLVVPDDDVRSALPPGIAAETLVASDLLASGDDTPVDVPLDPGAAAFVFFTSGSTGAPKGTLVGHGSALLALDTFPNLSVDDRLAVLAPLSFIGGSIAGIGIALTGASGFLFDVTHEDLSSLPGWIDQHGITLIGLSVGMVGMIARAAIAEQRVLSSVRLVAQGGEAGSAQHFADARRAFPNATFRYSYGMTETGSVAGHVLDGTTEPGGAPPPVGRPWPWVDVAVVDDDGRPVRDGEPGELLVTSPTVAFGYWNQPALTAERFVLHPDGRRTMRTGDRGRFRADGMLEHLGRIDRQVKVHGQLVDLTQVEQEVGQLPGVHDAVVSSVPTADRDHRLVAHLVVDRSVTIGDLRRGLATRLPPYAIPRAFFRVDQVSRTDNGKADRVWLRETAVDALPRDTGYVAPRAEAERAVAQLFEEVLAVDRVGAFDDFFELGGDSLSVVELQAALADVLQLELSVPELLADPTVAGVAARVGRGDRADAPLVVRLNRGARSSIFGIPGAANTPLQLRPLARRLPDVEFRAFAFRGMDARALPDRSVTAIARRNVTALRDFGTDQGICLFGYSFGGLVALEMAAQITDAGGDVDLLVLVEPPLPTGIPPLLERARSRVQLGTARADVPPDAPVRKWLERARAVGADALAYSRSRARTATTGVVVRRGVAQHDAFFSWHRRLMRSHRTRPHHGPVLLLGSRDYLEGVRSTADALMPGVELGGARRDVEVAGGHDDLLREPSVSDVARVLDLALATPRA